MAELLRRRDLVAGADMVELRLDGVTDVDVDEALAGRRLPVIVTCRPVWQGGRFEGDEATRLALLERAWERGAEFVDVEDGAADAFVARVHGRRIVRSYHDFEGLPGDAEARLRRLAQSGAEVVKLAVTARRLADVVTLKQLAALVPGKGVLIAMGPAGVTSRLLAARLGSLWSYAGDQVAPGQLSLGRMRDEFRVQTIGPNTAVYGVVGRPVEHSLSPTMHNAAFQAVGLDAVYVPLAAASFDDFAAFARAFDVRGASITAPFKEDAWRAATTSDDLSARLGAVNTLRASGAGWEARNTDVEGFLAPLAGRDLARQRVAILGAGGAARAVAEALRGRAARVTLYARRLDAAVAVAAAAAAAADAWPPAADAWDMLVNTTPVGTAPDGARAPIVLAGPLAGRLVYDLVYNPPDTALLSRARALGAETIGGLPMLVAQAVAQFHWWTGTLPDADRMHEAALARLAPPPAFPTDTV
ncbi:MAG: type I 3-dehydroquinate dehydratase [Acidobacteria bacterium]|nr:type I 3-dehydroquinate dehydratase [Acidobacteriota bacterium]